MSVDFLFTEFGDYEGALQHFGLHIWCWITKYPPIANTFHLKCIFCKHISYRLEQFHHHLIETHVEQFYKVSTPQTTRMTIYEFRVHALWYIRVWSIRVSTGFLKKIRVYQYPIANICKGIFWSQYSHF